MIMLILYFFSLIVPLISAAPLTDAQCSKTVFVVSGDTCYDLSIKYSMTIDEFVSCNKDSITDGQVCLIYAGKNYRLPSQNRNLVSGNTTISGNGTTIGTTINTPSTNGTDTSTPGTCPTPANQPVKISFTQFNEALVAARPEGGSTCRQVTCEEYTAFVGQASSFGRIASIDEFAMFLANIIHESDGLKAVREYACSNGQYEPTCDTYAKCDNSPESVSYYGRGYIQLTHCYNYKTFQEDLNDSGIVVNLVQNPDLVAEGTLPLMSALFYWKKYVHSDIANGKKFGSTVKNINGALECGQSSVKAQKRFDIYKNIQSTWEMTIADISDLTTDCPQ